MNLATKLGHRVKLGLLSVCLALITGFVLQQPVRASVQETLEIPIYFFWGNGCPHCAEAEPFLETLEQRFPGVKIYAFEVWYDTGNQALFQKMTAANGTKPEAVPTIFLADQYWVGWNDRISAELVTKIETCLASGSCQDPGAGVIPGRAEKPADIVKPVVNEVSRKIDLPIFGSVDLSAQSLFASTLLISFVDGFNPCSLWVLGMLLALTLHTGSRKKVLIIGLTFLTVTAAVYGLFIAGLFTFLTVVSFMGWVQYLVAAIALFFAAVNIKDYFWYKEGLSFTISDKEKPGIFQRMRRVMDASQSFWGLIGATIVMAAGVSLVEFSCTAGFPVVWTNLLTSQNVTAGTFVALLLLYMFVYQVDELIIFGAAVVTLKASKLEEKHGRILKLIGGILMFTLAMVMIINPALMNNLSSSLIIFAIAFAAAILILIVHRTVLPAFGIWIGTEAESKGKGKKQKARTTKHTSRH